MRKVLQQSNQFFSLQISVMDNFNTSQTQAYTFAPVLQTLLYLLVACLIIGGGFTLKYSLLLGFVLILLVLPVLPLVIITSGKAVLTSDGIEYTRAFARRRYICWKDIDDVRQAGRFASFVIVQGADVIRLSKQLVNFFRIIETVQYYRPDLFNKTKITRFHRIQHYLLAFLFAILISTIIQVPIIFGRHKPTRENVLMQVAIHLGCLLLLPVLLSRHIWVVVIEDGNLRLKYFFYEQRIPKSHVKKILFEEVAVVGRYSTASVIMKAPSWRMRMIAVYTTDEKKLLMNNFREGDAYMYKVLQQWVATSPGSRTAINR